MYDVEVCETPVSIGETTNIHPVSFGAEIAVTGSRTACKHLTADVHVCARSSSVADAANGTEGEVAHLPAS